MVHRVSPPGSFSSQFSLITSLDQQVENIDQTIYDLDFYGWTQLQIQALSRARESSAVEGVDWTNLIEEVRVQDWLINREMDTHLANIIRCLLSLYCHPTNPSCNQWTVEIKNFREELLDLVLHNTSLKSVMREPDFLDDTWRRGRSSCAKHLARSDGAKEILSLMNSLPGKPLWQLNEVCGFDPHVKRKQLIQVQKNELAVSLPDSLVDCI